LSYVIQNFFKINPVFRLTYRKYFYWLLKNYSKIILNFFYLTNINYSNFTVNPLPLLRFFFFKKAFGNALTYHYSPNTISWKPLVENSLIRSLQYWAFKKALNPLLIKTNPRLFKTNPLNPKLFLNQIVLEKKYSKMSLNNKTYKLIFNNSMLLLLFNWKVWRPSYNLLINLILIDYNWFILKRFNTQFFKVFFI
jgi:hypothetical protein